MKNFNKTIKINFYSIILILLFVPSLHAEVNSDTESTYKDFFKATGAEAQYEQMLDIMMGQFQKGFTSGLTRATEDDSNLSAEEKKHLILLLKQTINSYLNKMRVEIKKIMSFDKLVKNIYIPIYSKHFKVAEIKEISSFYKSPVGHKFISQVPALMQESMTMVNEKYTPQLQKISIKIAKQEFTKISQELAKIKKNDE